LSILFEKVNQTWNNREEISKKIRTNVLREQSVAALNAVLIKKTLYNEC
jgi:hypothetical protein